MFTISALKSMLSMFLLSFTFPALASGFYVHVTVQPNGTPGYVSNCSDGSGKQMTCNLWYDGSKNGQLDFFYANDELGGTDSSGFYDVDVNWSGCAQVEDRTTGSFCQKICDFRLAPEASATATFTKIRGSSSEVTAAKQGTGSGLVYSAGNVISCGDNCTQQRAILNSGKGSSVWLVAMADGNSTFSGWQGCPQPSDDNCTIPVNTKAYVTATFTLIPTHVVTVQVGPNGHTNTSASSYSVLLNRTFSFLLSPDTGYSMAATGCGGTLSGNTYTTGPVTQDCTVTVTFPPPPGHSAPIPAWAFGALGFGLTVAGGWILRRPLKVW